MKSLRTPDERFANLPDFPYQPHHTNISAGKGGNLRIDHLDAGPADWPAVLAGASTRAEPGGSAR